MITIEDGLNKDYIHRTKRLRAAILGAHYGITSISSIAIGVATASTTREPIVLSTVAGLVAGVLSMTVGEYISGSMKIDSKDAYIKSKLKTVEDSDCLGEMHYYAMLTDEVESAIHINKELGINVFDQVNPLQAALASGASFAVVGLLLLLVVLFAPVKGMEYWLYSFALVFLIILGVTSAKKGNSNITKAVLRITILGTIAMGLSALVGYQFGINN